MLSLLSTWLTTISLIFGGCCSNAVTLEQLTLQHPNAGSVVTFFQFLLISLYGLPKFLIWTWLGPRFRSSRVPITQYFLQVVLFYLISRLNNAAFAYRIPMAVHIIFRSGGLIISMLFGWLISHRQYSTTQIASVLLVTVGVILTTLSASNPSSSRSSPINPYTYAKGIGILTLALILSGFLGLLQDHTSSKYTRPSKQNGTVKPDPDPSRPASWQESMFYLHFLALPLFLPTLPGLATQMHTLNTSGPRAEFNFALPITVSPNLTTTFPLGIPPPYSLPDLPIHFFPQTGNKSLFSLTQSFDEVPSTSNPLSLSLSIPHIYLPLILNSITQLVCVAGVHRLTTRVSALTVTLVLVVRKAVSLIISIVGVAAVGAFLRDGASALLGRVWSASGLSEPTWVRGWNFNVLGLDLERILGGLGVAFVGPREGKVPQDVNEQMMWAGACMVLLGTIGYTIGSRPRGAEVSPSKDKRE